MDRPRAFPHPFPTAAQPLLGLTVLLVEDSRYAGEALRLMSLRSGARMRRADSLAAAQRHLRIYRPSVILVDLGLPDGDGGPLIRMLLRDTPRIAAILALSGEAEAAARTGADGYLVKPVRSLAVFQETILACLPPDRRPLAPRIVNEVAVEADRQLYHADLHRALALLGGVGVSRDQRQDGLSGPVLDYLTQFLGGISLCAGDAALATATEALQIARLRAGPCVAEVTLLRRLIRDRLQGSNG